MMATVLTDQEILREILLRNQVVFDGLYRDHYKKLFIISYRYTRNPEQSEEIVHDVFLKLWNLSNLPIITHSLAAYLSRATVNTSLNLLKREKFKNTYIRTEKELENMEVEDIDEADELEARLLLLEQGIGLLPEQCQKIMLLSKFDKIKLQDIANQLGISIKTVKNHLSYGYKKLKLHMDQAAVQLLLALLISSIGLFTFMAV